MYDVATIGHITIDHIISPRTPKTKPTPGGPPIYTSLAAKNLGAKTAIISKIGQDFPEAYIQWLHTQGINLSGLKRIKGAKTTIFTLEYRNEKRQMRLINRAPLIGPRDIPANLRAKAIHIAPIVSEIRPKTIHVARKITSILSLDPQGLVRHFDKNGNMKLKQGTKTKILEQIDIYKSSQEELKAATALTNLQAAMKKIQTYGAKIVITTKGTKGSTLLFKNRFREIPACEPRAVIDPTGAGDAYIGAFLAEYVRGSEPYWCACVGSAAASFVMEGIGATVFGEMKQVYTRAEKIFNA
jgi:sugar/nucleoside kinase (ribokinase family)